MIAIMPAHRLKCKSSRTWSQIALSYPAAMQSREQACDLALQHITGSAESIAVSTIILEDVS